jgi:hypothetical protein
MEGVARVAGLVAVERVGRKRAVVGQLMHGVAAAAVTRAGCDPGLTLADLLCLALGFVADCRACPQSQPVWQPLTAPTQHSACCFLLLLVTHTSLPPRPASLAADLADSSSDKIFTPSDLIGGYFSYTSAVGANIHSGAPGAECKGVWA